jgi:uncharacterized membrane protein
MNPILNEYINTGKPIDEIVNDKIKANNRQWFLIFCLFIVVWIGYSIVQNNRIKHITTEHSQCDSIHKVNELTIEMQLNKLNEAVYFSDIK